MKDVAELDLQADYYADLRDQQRRVNPFDKFDTQRDREKRKEVMEVRRNKLALTSVSWRDGVKPVDTDEFKGTPLFP